jgi:dynein heavy chain
MDLYDCRILANLNLMSHTLLLTLPQNEAWTTTHFLQEASAHSEAGGAILSSCSKKVEDALKELLEVLRNSASLPTINSFDSEDAARAKQEELDLFQTQCQDLFIYFKHRNLEALIASVRGTLDNLRRCITTSTSRSSIRYGIQAATPDDSSSHLTACFQADLILSIPNIVMQPSLEDMQNTVNQAVHYICEVGQHIELWTVPASSFHLSCPRSAGKKLHVALKLFLWSSHRTPPPII